MEQLLLSLPPGLDGLGLLAQLQADIQIAIEEQQSIIASTWYSRKSSEQRRPSYQHQQKTYEDVDLSGSDVTSDAGCDGQVIEGDQVQLSDIDHLTSNDVHLSRLDLDLPRVDDQAELDRMLSDLDNLEKKPIAPRIGCQENDPLSHLVNPAPLSRAHLVS